MPVWRMEHFAPSRSRQARDARAVQQWRRPSTAGSGWERNRSNRPVPRRRAQSGHDV